MIQTVRKTMYVTSDGKSWADRDVARKHELVCKLRDLINLGLQKHLDAEEIAHLLLAPEAPVIIVSKPERTPR